ncbi:MAG TPA: hypothetical protein VND93_12885 [Myxococcales bacterium]|nr:hypothetical protein [Myxococcales bacterium]
MAAAVAALVKKHGEPSRARIERGVKQVASFWREGEDGDLEAFCLEQFQADPAQLDALFNRLESALEQLDGHFNEIARAWRWGTDVETAPLLPVDPLLSAFDPWAHATDDLFRGKVAFVALLNFPLTRLEDRLRDGPRYTRREWAETRLTERFALRIPGEISQAMARAGADAGLYVDQYNIWTHHLRDVRHPGQRLFPLGQRLISHWNLRDQIKADYASPEGGLQRQRMLVQVMNRIVTQTIPRAVIDNPRLDWDPFTNDVGLCPKAEVEPNAPDRPLPVSPATAPEPDTRYAKLLAVFQAAKAADPYSPVAPTALARAFELGREIPEQRVAQLLEEILTSPLVPKVAKVIQQRLGRPLEPHDIWYPGFRPRTQHTEAELDAITRKKYPTADAYAADMPALLEKMGFSRERAAFLASHIKVDASRGAGHAMQAMRRGDFPHLRTRVEAGGMDYKGYNIAVHEMGHNVEQVFSLYEVDHTLLQGVPNNAFTEALAFVFQARDLELLGLSRPDPESERMRALDDFWSAFEISSVALVDVATWHWMYEHPGATPAQLRQAVVRIAKETWNKYDAPVLGGKDAVLLGIYSHMLSNPLYLADYPLGHLIAFQIEEHLRALKGPLGPELERMARIGNVAPDVWMTQATGAPVSTAPLLRAAGDALGSLPATPP